MSSLEDELARAMLSARAGDRDAYRRLLTRVSAMLRPYVGRRLGKSQAESEDVIQEVLLAIHRKSHTWDEARPILPWLYAICDHKLIDAGRRRQRHARTVAQDVSLDDVAETVAQPVEPMNEPGLDFGRALAGLPDRQRIVVSALGLEGQTVAGAAASLRMSEGAVRVAFHRGLKRLRALAGAAPDAKSGPAGRKSR